MISVLFTLLGQLMQYFQITFQEQSIEIHSPTDLKPSAFYCFKSLFLLDLHRIVYH